MVGTIFHLANKTVQVLNKKVNGEGFLRNADHKWP